MRPETGVGAPPRLKIFRECVCVCLVASAPHRFVGPLSNGEGKVGRSDDDDDG